MVLPEFPTSIDVERWNDAVVSSRRDVVAEEVPVALEYNGVPMP